MTRLKMADNLYRPSLVCKRQSRIKILLIGFLKVKKVSVVLFIPFVEAVCVYLIVESSSRNHTFDAYEKSSRIKSNF